jgi:TonB family protein
MRPLLRSASAGVGLSALGVSAVFHVVLFLAPTGSSTGSQVRKDDSVNVDVSTDLAPVPEATEPEHVAPQADRATNARSRVHLVSTAPAKIDAPAVAAPADTTTDDTPRFTIAIGAACDTCKGVAPPDATPPRDDDVAPIPEQAVDGQARLVRGVAPAYPDTARADGLEGDVHLELVVGTSGAVENASVTRGMGKGLDEAALSAARQFRFAPATKAGRPVRVRMSWSMQFRLR